MLEPCLTFTTVDLLGSMRTTRTEYVRGHDSRSDYSNCTGRGDPAQPDSVRYEYGLLRGFTWRWVVAERSVDIPSLELVPKAHEQEM